MRLTPLTAICFAVATGCASAAFAAQSLEFQGEHYEPVFSALNNRNDRFIEHTRPGDGIKRWKKLMVIHWYPNDTSAPDAATNNLAILAKRRNPAMEARLSENASADEAIVSFILTSADGRVSEVNVFKYARAAAGKGLVAIQYAFRLPANRSASDLNRAREKAFSDLKHFDMGRVRMSFVPSI